MSLCAAALASAAGTQDVYVWQRTWNEPVRAALARHGTNFQTVVALGAEISWRDRRPVTTRVALDHAALRATPARVGLALSIGPSAGPFRSNDAVAAHLTGVARSLLAEARSNGVAVAELQIDFDCAESRLDGYRVWVETLRRAVAPVPLIITTLPSWLRQPAFARLAALSDGFILQVHSLERPRGFAAPFTLCDPAAARRAVEQAAKVNVPFRVALPTYGYTVAFDARDQFIGLSADGPLIAWPAGTRLRDVRTDPAAMAQLVAFWATNRPPNLRGVIWYRLPIENENLNWRFSTLGVVMSGRVPQADLKVENRSPEPELAEIVLRNTGAADFHGDVSVRTQWRGARLLAGDSLGGFDLGKTGSSDVLFTARDLFLRAGEERKIGWLRTNGRAEVELEIKTQ